MYSLSVIEAAEAVGLFVYTRSDCSLRFICRKFNTGSLSFILSSCLLRACMRACKIVLGDFGAMKFSLLYPNSISLKCDRIA